MIARASSGCAEGERGEALRRRLCGSCRGEGAGCRVQRVRGSVQGRDRVVRATSTSGFGWRPACWLAHVCDQVDGLKRTCPSELGLELLDAVRLAALGGLELLEHLARKFGLHDFVRVALRAARELDDLL